MSNLIKLAAGEVQGRVKLSIGKLANQTDNICDLTSFLEARLQGKKCEVSDDEFVKMVESIEAAITFALCELRNAERWIDGIGGAA